MKILIVGPDPAKPVIGGVVTHVASLMRIFEKNNGHAVTLLDTNFDGQGKKRTLWQSIHVIRCAGYEGYEVIYLNTSIYFSSLIKLGLLLRRIHKACEKGNMPGMVVQFHGGLPENIGILQKLCVKFWLKHKLEECSKLMFLTAGQMEQFGKIFPGVRDRIMLSHQKIECPPQCPEKDFKVLTVLFLSRIEKEKGIYEFLKAALKFDNHPGVRFIIAGDGMEAGQVRELAKGLHNVTCVGPVYGEQKQALLKMCNIFCLMSCAEGVPYALLESMANGLIPVVTDVGGMREIVEKNDAGFIVKSDAQSFCKVLNQLIDDKQLARDKSCRAYLTMEKIQQEEASGDKWNYILPH